jgi:hypothetical protein
MYVKATNLDMEGKFSNALILKIPSLKCPENRQVHFCEGLAYKNSKNVAVIVSIVYYY